MTDELQTIVDLIRYGASRFNAAGLTFGHSFDNALDEATQLTLHALHLPHDIGPAYGQARVTLAEKEEVLGLFLRRIEERVPAAYLTGEAWFAGLSFKSDPRALVPRSPIAELIESGFEPWLGGREVRRALDLCTGSGAIARAVADEVPGADVHAVELDEGALAWAERNLAGTGVDLRHGDLATACDDLLGSVDVIVCNPPYIPLEAWESVAAEARDHDPHLALFSGQDGLDAMRVLERRAALLLRPGGVVGAEHADVQGAAAPGVFAASGRWLDVADHPDLAGRPRYLTARLAR